MSGGGVQFYRHHLGPAEAEAVAEVLNSLFLTTGPRTADFERAFADYLGVPFAVGLSSCTAALFLSLRALGIGEGDEVVTTPMTFIATSNAILHTGAKPVFADVEPDTGNLDVSKVEAVLTERTKAILPVHLHGQMVDMKALRALADRHQLAIVEDAAHALEAERDGVRPGQLGDIACFSFYATKNITCGEGGAIATRNEELAGRIKNLRLHGMTKDAYSRYSGTYRHWDMSELGYKANLHDLSAALLLPQLAGVDERLAGRDRVAAIYDEALDRIEGVTRPALRDDTRTARHLYTVWVDGERRDEVLSGMQAAQIGVAVNYRAVHLLDWYRRTFGFEPGAFPAAEKIGDETMSLPMYPGLTDAEARQVMDALADVVR